MAASNDKTILTESGEQEFVSWDSTRLFSRWLRSSAPRAAVVFVHGIVEHSGRYEALAKALAAADISFFTFDHRGHGRSSGTRASIRSFDDYIKDLAAFCKYIRSLSQGLPLFIVGHSMGSLIIALYAAGEETQLNGIALASLPSELIEQPSIQKTSLVKVLARFLPGLRVKADLDPAELSHDEAVVQRTKSDPLMQKQVTVRLAVELFEAIESLPAKAGAIRVPTLMLHGGEDTVASVAGARKFLDWVSSADKQLIEFPGLRHELFNETEPERNRVFDELIQWILGRATNEEPT